MNFRLLAKNDVAITAGGFTLLAAVFVFAFYLPESKTRARLEQEIRATEASIRDIPVRLAETAALEAQAAKTREAVTQLQKRVPGEADVHHMIQQVTALARRTQLQVSRIEPLAPAPQQAYQKLSFRMNFGGAYGNILKFLQGLEKQERLFTIDELATTKRSANSGKTVECDMVFSVYVTHTEKSDFTENNGKSSRVPADTQIR